MPINLRILDIFLKLDLEINKPMAFHAIGRLEQSKISTDTKTKISQLLNQHNDFAHRVLYQTIFLNKYHDSI